MLLAVMDLGSNSFKMTVAQWAPELSKRKPFRPLHKERHPIQLGGSVFAEGRISKDDFKKALQALRKMQGRLRDFASPVLRVVATSAIRDAENGAQFVDFVRRELGLAIEVISGKQEAALIARGLEIEYPRLKRGLLIDIGGGSTEIATFGTDGHGKDALCRSIKVGSVRVASRFFEGTGAPEIEKARRHIRECFKTLNPGPIERLVGSAGTIQSLGEILAPDTLAKVVHRSKLSAWIEENFARTPKQLEKRFGLRPSRARVIVPGALVLNGALEALGQNAIAVTGMTLRDGLLVDLVESWVKPRETMLPETLAGELPRGNGLSKAFVNEVETLAARFFVNVGTGQHIAYLANGFYLQMQRYRGRGTHEEDLRCLTAASFLYYCGRSINEADFEKHSAYVVENAALKSLSARERNVVARIILNARSKSAPAKNVALWGYNDSQTERIFRLSALFRLAVTLDEIETQNILNVDLKLKGKQALIRLMQRGPSRLNDVEVLRDRFRYFEQVFGLKVVAFVDHHPAS